MPRRPSGIFFDPFLPGSPHHFFVRLPMNMHHRDASSLEHVFSARKRVNRLLKRVASALHVLPGLPSVDNVIWAATCATLASCKIDFRIYMLVVRVPGGFLFIFWILAAGPLWLFNIVHDQFKVRVILFSWRLEKYCLDVSHSSFHCFSFCLSLKTSKQYFPDQLLYPLLARSCDGLFPRCCRRLSMSPLSARNSLRGCWPCVTF